LKEYPSDYKELVSETAFPFDFGSDIQIPILEPRTFQGRKPPSTPLKYRTPVNIVEKDIGAFKRVIWQESEEYAFILILSLRLLHYSDKFLVAKFKRMLDIALLSFQKVNELLAPALGLLGKSFLCEHENEEVNEFQVKSPHILPIIEAEPTIEFPDLYSRMFQRYSEVLPAHSTRANTDLSKADEVSSSYTEFLKDLAELLQLTSGVDQKCVVYGDPALKQEIGSLFVIIKRLQNEVRKLAEDCKKGPGASLFSKSNEKVDFISLKKEFEPLFEDSWGGMMILDELLGAYNSSPEETKSCIKEWDRVAIGNGSFVWLSQIKYRVSEASSTIHHWCALLFEAIHQATETRLE
jgi:hypothetical protein